MKAYDAAYPSDKIPTDGDFYLSYTDFAPYMNEFHISSLTAMEHLFPDKTVSITSTTADRNDLVADCESGALSPQVTADWAYDRVHANKPAVIYCSTDENIVHGVVLALGGRGLQFADPAEWPKPGVYWWAANWSDGPNIPYSAIGVQYQSLPDYDTSVFRVSLLDTSPALPSPTPPAEFVDISVPLLKTDMGDEVRESVRSLQTVLNARKDVIGHTADLVVDGRYGAVTADVVREWQKVFKLAENGQCGTKEWEAVLEGTAP